MAVRDDRRDDSGGAAARLLAASPGVAMKRRRTTDHRRPTMRRPTADDRPSEAEDRGLKIEDSTVDTSELRSSILHPLSSIHGGRWSVVRYGALFVLLITALAACQSPAAPP